MLGRPAKIKLGEEVVGRALENPTVGRTIAGAYYHATDARFTAWGKYSKVLVPRAAGKLATLAEKASPYGWAVFEVEAGHALYSCTEVLE